MASDVVVVPGDVEEMVDERAVADPVLAVGRLGGDRCHDRTASVCCLPDRDVGAAGEGGDAVVIRRGYRAGSQPGGEEVVLGRERRLHGHAAGRPQSTNGLLGVRPGGDEEVDLSARADL